MSFESLHELGQVKYYGNELGAWVKAFVQFAVWFTVLPIARVFLMRRFRKQEAHHPVAFLLLLRALIDATTRIFMIAIAIYLAMRWLEVPERVDRVISMAILVIVWCRSGSGCHPPCDTWSTCAAEAILRAPTARRASTSCASSACFWSGSSHS
jgi:hypothetical protein